jgi:3D (Asp-Asp-Asp) domain-containing protein
MSVRTGGKLFAVSVVIASLITAFSAPPLLDETQDVTVQPAVALLESPRQPQVLPQAAGPSATPVYVVRATGYNSLPEQTWGDPHVTATGTRTRFGIIAVSRDLLGGAVPYGSLVRLRDLGGYHNGRGEGMFQERLDAQQLFVVEDTLHARKRNQIDVWFPEKAEALQWGVRKVELELVRYGYDGPEIYSAASSDFDGALRLAAVN